MEIIPSALDNLIAFSPCYKMESMQMQPDPNVLIESASRSPLAGLLPNSTFVYGVPFRRMWEMPRETSL